MDRARFDIDALRGLAGEKVFARGEAYHRDGQVVILSIEPERVLFSRLDTAAATIHADDKTLEARLHKAIDGAMRTRGYVDYREAAGWAEGVAAALDLLAEIASAGRAGLVLKLAEWAVDRIE